MITVPLQLSDQVVPGETIELRLGEARTLRFPISDRSTAHATAEDLAGAAVTVRIYDQANNLIVDGAGSIDADTKIASFALAGDAIEAPGLFGLEVRILTEAGGLFRLPEGQLQRMRVRELLPSGDPPVDGPTVPPGVATTADLAALARAMAKIVNVEVSASRDLAIEDVGCWLLCDSDDPIQLLVQPDTFESGDFAMFEQVGNGRLSIMAADGLELSPASVATAIGPSSVLGIHFATPTKATVYGAIVDVLTIEAEASRALVGSDIGHWLQGEGDVDIAIVLNTGDFIEGDFVLLQMNGTADLRVQAGTGITLSPASVVRAQGVMGIRFTSPTEAVAFGAFDLG